MNVDQLEGKWHVIKGKLREQWGKLSRDDVDRMNGQEEQLLGKLQELYGMDRERARKELEIWLAAQREDETAV